MTNNVQEIRKDSEIDFRSRVIKDEELRECVIKGRYDINYVISLLRIIEGKCEKGKFRAEDLRFSLQQSCKQMIGYLEVERDCRTSLDPVMMRECPKCRYSELVVKSRYGEWDCAKCKERDNEERASAFFLEAKLRDCNRD